MNASGYTVGSVHVAEQHEGPWTTCILQGPTTALDELCDRLTQEYPTDVFATTVKRLTPVGNALPLAIVELLTEADD